MRSVLILHWHRESKKKQKNERELPVKARSERVRSNYSIRVKWILGNIRGRLPNNLWSSCNCIQILQSYLITLFFLGLHCKDPCSLFRLFLYFKYHNLFTYRYTEYGIDCRPLLYYVYLIEELFKDGRLPLLGPERKTWKPWKETDRNRTPKKKKKQKNRTMFQRSAR